MASMTFGPVGALYRGAIRRQAFALNLRVDEQSALVDSMFRVHGSEAAVEAMRLYITRLVDRLDAMDRADELRDQARAAKKAMKRARRRWWNPKTWCL